MKPYTCIDVAANIVAANIVAANIVAQNQKRVTRLWKKGNSCCCNL